MKTKLIFSLVFIFLGSTVANADGDGKWALDLNLGYNWGMKSSVLGTNDSYGQLNQVLMSENIRGSFGGGIQVQLSALYTLNDCIKLGLGIGNVFGSDFTYHEYSAIQGSGEQVVNTDYFFVNPHVVTTLCNFSDNFSLESNLGLIFNIGGTIVETETENGINFALPYTYESVIETKVAAHMGFTGGLNLNFGVSENVSLNLGFGGRVIRPMNKESEITKAEYNGMDLIDNAMPYEVKTNYVDELNTGSNNMDYNPFFNQNSATDRLQSQLDLSSYSLGLGVRFDF